MNKGHLQAQAQKWRQKEVRGLPQPHSRQGAEEWLSSCSWLRPLQCSYHMCLLLWRELHHMYHGAGRSHWHIGEQHAVPEGSCFPVVAQWMGQRRTQGWGQGGEVSSCWIWKLWRSSNAAPCFSSSSCKASKTLGEKQGSWGSLSGCLSPPWLVCAWEWSAQELCVHPSEPLAALAQLCPLQHTLLLLLGSCPWMPASFPGSLCPTGWFPMRCCQVDPWGG